MRTGLFLLAWLMVATALAGCSTGPSTPTTTPPTTILVTRPGDFSGDANATGANAPHLHDYWQGAQRLVVMDGWPTEPGPGLGGGSEVPIYHYRPPSGNVVPQGAAAVEVTMNWTADQDDIYQDPQLWVRTAAENQSHKVGPVVSGQMVSIPTTNDANDLPHQLLSAWVFEFRLSQRDDVQVLRFKANVTIHVDAVRGLDIPLYPGHPDRWDGQSNITLVDVTRQILYMQDPGDAGCDGVSCPATEVPRNGTIVPPDAAFVSATLTFTYGSPTQVGLSYHGAEGRAFQRLTPSVQGNTKTYHIDVGTFGDGPYAKTSQWEFAPFIEGPAPDTVAFEEYHLVVVAHRTV